MIQRYRSDSRQELKFSLRGTLSESRLFSYHLAVCRKKSYLIKAAKASSRKDISLVLKKEVHLVKELGVMNVVSERYDSTRPYVAYEYDGPGDLSLLIDGHSNPVPPQEAVMLVLEVLSTTHLLHALGYLHRELSPRSLFLTTSGAIKVADFAGAIKFRGQSCIETSLRDVSSYNYLAPECLSGEGVGRTSDIYSVGMILAELVIGEYPFLADTFQQQVKARITGLEECLEKKLVGISRQLQRVIKKSLAPDVRNRYLEVDKFRQDLKSCL